MFFRFATAQFGLSPSPGGPIIVATHPVNGFSNSGTATCLELTASDCPAFNTLAAEIEILAMPGNISRAAFRMDRAGTSSTSANA